MIYTHIKQLMFFNKLVIAMVVHQVLKRCFAVALSAPNFSLDEADAGSKGEYKSILYCIRCLI
jgi:hypothetical protein